MLEFRNDYILINDNGIDLLRNRFPYRHIDFSEVQSTKIFSGYLLQNRLIPFLAGILIIAASFKLLSPVIEIFKEVQNTSAPLYGRGVAFILIAPLILFSLGAYFLIQSLKKSKILRIVTGSDHYNIRIKEFEKADKIHDLIVFLNKKLQRFVGIAV